MTDRDDLERLLRETPPPAPDATSRVRDVSAAMAAFDAHAATAPEKNLESTQGTDPIARPTIRQQRRTLWRRLMTMNFELPKLSRMTSRTMMMGTASVAVMVLAIGAFQIQTGDLGKIGDALTGDVAVLEESESAPPAKPAAVPLPTTEFAQPTAGIGAHDGIALQSDASAPAVSEFSAALAPAPVDREHSAEVGRSSKANRAVLATGCSAGTAACQPGAGGVPVAVPMKREAARVGADEADSASGCEWFVRSRFPIAGLRPGGCLLGT